MGIRAVTGYIAHVALVAYRRTVAAPRHRLPLARRARMLDLRPRPRTGAAPLHLRGDDLGPAVSPIAD